ncbi:MAG: DUF3565 domain-containing protein [Acidobacteriaceae bacterium]|nr:DUF3565 domain-containing protein [Acidobacteriaceae bacterium]MBV9296076.1 DUF3565 domain-containing protein [Acidobacteriaceae bacterium]MBV9765786.1 DUF3565 domain-containing protein [Acidobacteriaceae bacterium]
MDRAVIGFHKDDQDHWVADLECGHTRHVRHSPPWQNRPWVLTAEGRAKFLGTTLNCVQCDQLPANEMTERL